MAELERYVPALEWLGLTVKIVSGETGAYIHFPDELTFVDPDERDTLNAEGTTLILDAIEAKGCFVAVYPLCEETTEGGLILPGERLRDWRRARRTMLGGYWCEVVKCGSPSYALDAHPEGKTRTLVALEAALALYESQKEEAR